MGSLDQPQVLKHRITVAAYYRMGEAGIIAPGARVELIEGEIIDMAPIGSGHGGTVKKLNRLVQAAVGDRAVVSVQDPVRLSDTSEPQPDVMVLRPRDDMYTASHPSPAEVLLVIEVADTSLEFDRSVKVPLYARHGITEVWLVDLRNRLLTVHRKPKDGIYRDTRTTGAPGVLELSQLAGVSVDLGGLF